MKVAKVASAAAEGMVSSLRIKKPRIPWLFFEGVELAAKQVRNGELVIGANNKMGIFWADVGSLFWFFLVFPTLILTTKQ